MRLQFRKQLGWLHVRIARRLRLSRMFGGRDVLHRRCAVRAAVDMVRMRGGRERTARNQFVGFGVLRQAGRVLRGRLHERAGRRGSETLHPDDAFDIGMRRLCRCRRGAIGACALSDGMAPADRAGRFHSLPSVPFGDFLYRRAWRERGNHWRSVGRREA